MRSATVTSPARSATAGLLAGFAAYGIWGLFPLYFDALKPTGPWEILAYRILFTLAVCAVAVAVTRDLGWLRPVLRQRRLLAGIALAAVLIAINWLVYVIAVTTGHTSDAALGYFLNPLVTVALGVLVLGERLRPLQWAAVGIGVVAGVFMTVAGGRFPAIALTLACSFALYGLVKKKVGDHLPALHGLTVETAILTPVAAAMLVATAMTTGLTIGDHGAVHTVLLSLAGVFTAIPLLFFAAAARRIPLVTVGLIQFITPVVQLALAVTVLHEAVTTARWVGFGIVWLALVVLTADALSSARTRRLAAGQAAPR